MPSVAETIERLHAGETLAAIAKRKTDKSKRREPSWRKLPTAIAKLNRVYRTGCYLDTARYVDFTTVSLCYPMGGRDVLTSVLDSSLIATIQALLDELNRLRAAESKAA